MTGTLLVAGGSGYIAGLTIRQLDAETQTKALLTSKSPESAHRFLNLHSATYNSFYFQHHLLDRTTFKRHRKSAFVEWNAASAVA